MNYLIAIISAAVIARLAHSTTEMRNSSLSAYIFAVLYILARLAFPVSFGDHCGEMIHLCQLLFILSFFALFSEGNSYCPTTLSESVNSFITFMMPGIATLFLPMLFWFIPVYLCSQVMLRTLTPKSILAAGLGILVPWAWKWGLDGLQIFSIPDFRGSVAPSFSPLWASIVLLAIYIIGVWHFYRKMYFDKSHTRVVYQVIMFFGLATFIMLFILVLSMGKDIVTPGFLMLYFIAIIPTTLLISRMADRMI